jgi:hypothetical protein
MRGKRGIGATYMSGRNWLPLKMYIVDEKRNPTHPVNVGGHEDVPNENEVGIKGYFPPFNWNINCQEE